MIISYCFNPFWKSKCSWRCVFDYLFRISWIINNSLYL